MKFAIAYEREELFRRINVRVEDMVEHGLLDEARSVIGKAPAEFT